MGFDLRLLPLDSLRDRSGQMWGYSHTILQVPRGNGTIEALYVLAEAKAVELPPGAAITAFCTKRVPDGSAKGEHMYGECTNDCFGKRYTYVTAAQLVPVLQRCLPQHPTTAYLAALAPTNLVILDWY